MKAFKSFLITLAIILVIGVIFIFSRRSILADVESTTAATEQNKSANPVKKAAVEKAMDTYIEKSDGRVKEIVESMSEEDKDTVTEIIANNVSLDSIPDVTNYVSSGDANALLDYAQENFSDEEIAELTEIMKKYVSP